MAQLYPGSESEPARVADVGRRCKTGPLGTSLPVRSCDPSDGMSHWILILVAIREGHAGKPVNGAVTVPTIWETDCSIRSFPAAREPRSMLKQIAAASSVG